MRVRPQFKSKLPLVDAHSLIEIFGSGISASGCAYICDDVVSFHWRKKKKGFDLVICENTTAPEIQAQDKLRLLG